MNYGQWCLHLCANHARYVFHPRDTMFVKLTLHSKRKCLTTAKLSRGLYWSVSPKLKRNEVEIEQLSSWPHLPINWIIVNVTHYVAFLIHLVATQQHIEVLLKRDRKKVMRIERERESTFRKGQKRERVTDRKSGGESDKQEVGREKGSSEKIEHPLLNGSAVILAHLSHLGFYFGQSHILWQSVERKETKKEHWSKQYLNLQQKHWK